MCLIKSNGQKGSFEHQGLGDALRVALACIRYAPAPGGAETHVQALAEGFAKRGHEVVVHTSDLFTEYPFARLERDAPAGAVRVVRHRARRLAGSWTVMPTMARALREERVDLVHAHSYGYHQTIAAARAARRKGIPFVLTPHYHPPWSMEGGAGRRVLRAAFDPTLGRFVVRAADRIVGVSSGEIAEMARTFALDADKVRLIPNGFHAERFADVEGLRQGLRLRLGLPLEAPLVVYAGRLASNKGLPALVEAFATLPSEAHLVLAGQDQGWAQRLREQADRLGCGKRLHVLGHLDEARYVETLAAATVFALPSEWEAFGIVLAEAMACGVPCVATRVGGAPDVVQDGVTGRLVPYGDARALADALAALLADPEARRRMGAAGRARALADFSWDAVVDRTLALYGELV